MKAKAIAMSVLSTVSIMGGVLNTQTGSTSTKTVHAATTAVTRYIGAKYGSFIYNSNGAAMTKTSRTLAYASAWKTFGAKTVAGVSYTNLGGNQWVKSSDLCINRPASVYYIDYTAGYGIAVYSSPAGKATSKKLAHASALKACGLTNVNGQDWIKVGTNAWINASYTSTTKPATRYVKYKIGHSIAVYSAAGGKVNGKSLKHGTKITTFQSVRVGSLTWTNIGHNAWVQSQYLSTTKPSTSTTTGVTYHMTATAYDPRVLGNYTFGYDTVAANLSRFPRGTKLQITFASGKVKNYVVRDTGGFAYSNPNQLDIAMPNSQALQFGRQSITVRILK